MNADSQTVLLVDDDEVFRSRLARSLSERGFEVRTASDYDSALAAAKEESPEYAVVDLRMPGHSGLEVVRDLAALDASTRILVLTGYGSIATAVDAVRLGAIQYLTKPVGITELLAAFARAQQPPLMPQEADFRLPSLARAEWEYIQRALAECAGNVSEAARRLGMHRRSLQRKLSKYPPADGQ